jgi:SAM-dependent methyltransferase
LRVLEDHPRYRDDWFVPFHAAALDVLRPGAAVLDVGGGRRPAIPRAMLPPDVRYVGMDLSRRELARAPDGTYDEMIEADIVEPVAALASSFDLVVSWQVLEHVRSMRAALENVRSYLAPGGRFVAQLSGGRAVFALVNRAVPHAIAAKGMKVLLGREPETVFPAPYDGCTYSSLGRLLSDWSRVQIEPRFRGAQYLEFAKPVQWAYVKAEDALVRGRRFDLATHYLVVADK